MTSPSDARWAIAVRALALVSVVLFAIVLVEARTVRRARAEIDTLRAEREQVKADWSSTWIRQSVDELEQAIRELDGFVAEPSEGLGKAGGLCAGGELNSRAIVDFAIGGYARSRAERRSHASAIDDMKTAVQKTDEYRKVHPDLAPAK